MPVPLHIFGCYSIYFPKPSDVIKADLMWMLIIETVSTAVDCNPLIFVDWSRHMDITYNYRQVWYLVHSLILPSYYFYRILGAEGGNPQTSKIQSFQLGGMGIPFLLSVHDPCHICVSTPIFYWNDVYHLRLLGI